MLLGLDVGNSVVSGAFFNGDLDSFERFSFPVSSLIEASDVYSYLKDTALSEKSYNSVIITSVVPDISELLDDFFNSEFGIEPLFVGPDLRLGISLGYTDPWQLGADRITNAQAIYSLYGAPSCVIDCGTAVTLSLVNKNGVFEGGIIAPGMNIAARALASGTARLPHVNPEKPCHLIGKDTRGSIQSGIFYGCCSMIEGFIKRISGEYGDNCVFVITGGQGGLVSAELVSVPHHYDPFLTLKGLKIIHDLNK